MGKTMGDNFGYNNEDFKMGSIDTVWKETT